MSKRFRVELTTFGACGEQRVLYIYARDPKHVRRTLIAHGIYETAAIVLDGEWDPARCQIVESSDEPVFIGDVYPRARKAPSPTVQLNGAAR